MKKLILIAILFTGCASPLQLPSEKVVDYVLPEYIEYVKANDRISLKQKKRRIEAVQSFVEAVESGR